MIRVLSTGFDSEGTPLVTGVTSCPKGHDWSWETYDLRAPIVSYCCVCKTDVGEARDNRR